jgi:hypothetical protein
MVGGALFGIHVEMELKEVMTFHAFEGTRLSSHLENDTY